MARSPNNSWLNEILALQYGSTSVSQTRVESHSNFVALNVAFDAKKLLQKMAKSVISTVIEKISIQSYILKYA